MLSILREYIEDNIKVTEYTKDGISVSHTVKALISDTAPDENEPLIAPALEDKINYLFYKAKGLVE